MSAARFIERIRAAGFSIEAQGSSLAIAPASRLTPEQREFVRQHRAAILAEIGGDSGRFSEIDEGDNVAPSPHLSGLAKMRAILAGELTLESSQGGNDFPPCNDAGGDMTAAERGLLTAMGRRWNYSPSDWALLWDACQDPAARANWLRVAEGEMTPIPDPQYPWPTVTVRIEADIGDGRKLFDLAVPAHRWDESEFAGQIAGIPSAAWRRLGTPKRCADCRHAKPTKRAGLVSCEQRDDPPVCGFWWSDDEKLCREFAGKAAEQRP